jgi:hypothetical protein
LHDAEHLPAILAFLDGIGIPVRVARWAGDGFLPGILLEDGGMLIDPPRMLGAGDLLHEAGHLAVVPARWRRQIGRDAGASLAAIKARHDQAPPCPATAEPMAVAWSFAAAMQLGIPPEVVFLEGGYLTDGGGGYTLLPGFTADTRNQAVGKLRRAGLIHSLRRGRWRHGIVPLVACGMTGPPAALADLPDNGLPPFPAMARWLAA